MKNGPECKNPSVTVFTTGIKMANKIVIISIIIIIIIIIVISFPREILFLSTSLKRRNLFRQASTGYIRSSFLSSRLNISNSVFPIFLF